MWSYRFISKYTWFIKKTDQVFLLTCNTLLTSYSSTRRNCADRKNLTCLTRDIFQRSISFFLDPSLRAHLCSCVCVCRNVGIFSPESLPFNRWKNKKTSYILSENYFLKLLKFKKLFLLVSFFNFFRKLKIFYLEWFLRIAFPYKFYLWKFANVKFKS